MNEFIFRSAVRLFLCPETRLACFKLQARFVCSSFLLSSPEWVQGAMPPGAGFQGPHRPLTFFPGLIASFTEKILEEESYESSRQTGIADRPGALLFFRK
ncbi:MAG: hypothetical protein K5919_08425 [Clostridiales bacterium]|nr:hypothetical protein [Clostridiales bacterium]